MKHTNTQKTKEDAQRLYQEIADVSLNLNSIVDDQYVYQVVNQRYTQIFHKPKDFFIGRTIAEVAGDQEFEEKIKPLVDRCLQGEEVNSEYWIDYPDLGERYVVARYVPVKDVSGSVTKVVINVRDITDSKRVEKELLESEKKFKSAFGDAAIGMALVGSDGTLFQVNNALCQMWGYTEDELIGRHFNENTHLDDVDSATEVYQDFIAGKLDKCQVEKRYLHKDGHEIWSSTSLASVFGADGDLAYVTAQIQDITERKQAEQALRQSEEQLRRYFDAGLIGMSIFSPDKGWLQINDNYCDIVGYSRQELQGMSFADFTHPDDREASAIQFSRVLAGEIDRYTIDKRYIRKDGEVVYITLSTECIRKQDGTVDCFVGFMLDITESKKVEVALQKSEERFELAIAGSNDGLWDWDIKTNSGWWSPRFYELLGLDGGEHEPTGEDFQDLLHPQDRERVLEAARAHLEEEKPYDIEYRLRLNSGQYRWFRSRGQAIWNKQGEAVRMSGSIQDISERRQAEERLNIFQQIVSSTSNFMSYVDNDFIYREVNDAYLNAFGKTHDEIVGQSVEEIFGKEIFENIPKQQFDQCFSGKPVSCEVWLDFPIRGKRFLNVHLDPHLAEDGSVKGIVISTTDITERKQAEEALQESEERFEFAVKGSSDGFWDWNIITGNNWWSPRFLELLGYAEGELDNSYKTFLKLLHLEDKDEVQEASNSHLEKRVPYDIEFRLQKKSGQYHWFRGRGQAVWDEQGVAVRMSGSIQDISERRQAEESLRRSEELLRSYYDAGLVGMALTTPEKGLLQFNDTYCEIVGYPREELARIKWSDLNHPDDLAGSLVQFNRMMAGEIDDYSQDKRVIRKDGKIVYVTVTTKCVRKADGTVDYQVTFIQDITERKQAEELLIKRERQLADSQAVAKLGSWDMNVVSHELDWSDETYRLFDKEPELFTARLDEFIRMIHPDDVEIMQTIWKNTLAGDEKPYHIVVRIVNDSGREWVMESYGEVRRDKENNVIGVFGTVQDISVRKQAEQELRKSEEKFSKAVNATPDSVVISRVSDGMFLFVNPGYTELLGYTEQETIGKVTAELNIWIDTNERVKMVNKLNEEGEIKEFEAVFRSKTGESIPVSLSATFIDIEGEKNIVSWTRDLRESKQAEEALRKSEQRLRSYFDAGLVGMVITDPEKGFVQINDTFSEILGYSHEELAGITWADITHPDEQSIDIAEFNRVMSGEIDGWSRDKRFIRKDGQIINASISSKCVRKADGSVDYFVVFLQDITQRKQAESALYRSHRALQVLNECNHTIVHASTGQELINEICRILVETGGYRFAWVGYAQSDETKRVYPVASAGYEAGYLDNDFSWDTDRRKFDPVTDAICSAEPFIIKNLGADPSYESLRNAAMERAYRSEIALPLHAGEKAFGALMIYASEIDAFDTEEEKLLIRLADDLAYGILSMHSRMEREHADQFLRDSENKYRLLYDENPSMFFTLDKLGTILSINKFGAKQLGYTDEELIGSSIFNLSHKAHRIAAEEHLQNCLLDPAKTHRWEQQKVSKEGKLIWVRESARVITDANGGIMIFMICDDITETHKLSEKLSYQAIHDPLTDLINRNEFESRLKQLLSSTHMDDRQHALCYMNLDRFRLVNENIGHAAGDELLRQLSTILNTQVRKRDSVARLGGDEFAVLMEHCPLHRAESVTKKMIQAITEYKFLWEGKSHGIGISAGLVPIDKYSGSVTEILMNAETACSIAKQEHDHIHIYYEDDIGYVRKHAEAEWVAKIHEALENDNFQLYFQPIVALGNNKKDFERYEVLVRMETEQGDIVTPDVFLPIAENYNLTSQIDQWVIKKLFSLLAGLPEQGKSMPQYSINLSGNSLGDRELLEFINQQFENSLIPPAKICFEITETVLIANLTNAMRFIKNLKDRGCFFALDDFGSGFSSFAYLKNLQVDYLKIDGLFIRDIATNSTDCAIVKSMHEIGKTLGKQTVAEYVENEEIFNILRDIGVDYAQGNYIGESQPFEQIYRLRSANIINFSKKRS